MATFRIITANKKASDTLDTVETFLAEAYPDWKIENLVENEDGDWEARLVTAGEPPAFLKEKSEAPEESPEEEAGESSEEEAEEDAGKDDDENKSEDDKDKGDKKDKGKGDPVKEVQKVIDELQGLLSDLGGKTQELQDAHQEKSDKLQEISDTVGDEGGVPPGLGPDAELSPEAIGPTPGSPPAGPPKGGIPPIPKRPGVPGGGAPRPGVPSSFAGRKRNTEIATHPGVDSKGERVSLSAALVELESDPQFKDYEVVSSRQEGTKYVVKLQHK